MFCTNCGTQFEGNFCPNCGIPANTAPQPLLKKPAAPGHPIKICRNCGDRLLAGAVKCPTCGKKDLLLLDSNDIDQIQEIIANAPHPKEGIKPLWKERTQPVSAKTTAQSLTKRARIRENRKNGIACCPKCGSTSLSASQAGFNATKAAIGRLALGELGFAAGNMGSKKVTITCLNCGHQWKP